jgi:hypothetical protein
MMMAMGTKNVKVWISENLRARLGAKVFLGLALGALLLAGTTMYSSMSQGEAGSPSASGETTQAFQPSVYMGPEDPELAEAPYDDLLKSFIGVPVSSNEAIGASQPYTLPEIFEEDVNERVYDELRQSFTGIPYNGSGREDLVVDLAWQPFGSLLPDTEYYRNPDFNDRQMRPSSK